MYYFCSLVTFVYMERAELLNYTEASNLVPIKMLWLLFFSMCEAHLLPQKCSFSAQGIL